MTTLQIVLTAFTHQVVALSEGEAWLLRASVLFGGTGLVGIGAVLWQLRGLGKDTKEAHASAASLGRKTDAIEAMRTPH